MGRHLLFLPPTFHPQYLSSVLKLVPVPALVHSPNPPRGDLFSVTRATVPLPSFLGPRFLVLRRCLPLDPPCDQTILSTEHRSRWGIGTRIPEMTSVQAGKRRPLSLLPSILSRTTARRIPISMTSSVVHQIPRSRSQSSILLLHVREIPQLSCQRNTNLGIPQSYLRVTTTASRACLVHPLRSARSTAATVSSHQCTPIMHLVGHLVTGLSWLAWITIFLVPIRTFIPALKLMRSSCAC